MNIWRKIAHCITGVEECQRCNTLSFAWSECNCPPLFHTETGPKVGTSVIIVKNDTILLAKRLKPYGYGQMALPGGHVEFFEHSREAAKREVLEETGLKTANLRMMGFTEDFDSAMQKHYITIFYMSDWVGGEPANTEPDKSGPWQWVKMSDLKGMRSQLWPPCIEKFTGLGWM
jgi:8-oxo-dGTP diphosphatase